MKRIPIPLRVWLALVLALFLAVPSSASPIPFSAIRAFLLTKVKVFGPAGIINTANLNGNTGAATSGSYVPATLYQGANTFTFQVVGTYVGQLAVQQTADGLNWVSVSSASIINASDLTTGIAANGQSVYYCQLSGGGSVRIVATAWTSGTLIATLSTGSGSGPAGATSNPTAGGYIAVTTAGTVPVDMPGSFSSGTDWTFANSPKDFWIPLPDGSDCTIVLTISGTNHTYGHVKPGYWRAPVAANITKMIAASTTITTGVVAHE